MRKLVLIVVLSACLPSCVSLTPAGGRVRRTNNPEVVKGCRFIGNVSESSLLDTPTTVENIMANKAAEMGGDTLFVTEFNPKVGKGSGEVYDCSRRNQPQ